MGIYDEECSVLFHHLYLISNFSKQTGLLKAEFELRTLVCQWCHMLGDLSQGYWSKKLTDCATQGLPYNNSPIFPSFNIFYTRWYRV